MIKEKFIANCARVAGVLLLLSTIPHSTLGWAEVMTAIKLGDINKGMANTVKGIWIFSSMMLVLSGVWALFLVSELRQLKRRAWWQGVFIGLGYSGSAIACMFMTEFYAHLAGYALIGLLLLVPLLIWAGSFRNSRPEPPSRT
jgi:hypothetical protein